jgi:YjbE family integral membrane protein
VSNTELLTSLLEILGVNIILSGDNAVVIALAARNLPRKHQRTAIILGSAAAIVLRVVLTLVAAEMLKLPWLRLAGGALLLWIGVGLLIDDDDGGGHETGAGRDLWGAVRTILMADLVMSLDNVLGVAAAAKGHFGLLIGGLVLSIPLIMFGSGIILRIMDRFPIIVTLGAALIGYVAGEMLVDEPVLAHWLHDGGRWVHYGMAIACAVFVVLVGTVLARRAKRPRGAGVVDLGGSGAPDKSA